MYFFYKQGVMPPPPILEEGMTIRKQRPKPCVEGMRFMQIGVKRYWYFEVMTFLYRGFSRVFEEYDIVLDNRIVSKAVLISKVPKYQFLPPRGIHLCFCETIEDSRGKGYYPLLLSYIQNNNPTKELYMVVDENNHSSIRGIEKAGFVRYAVGNRLPNGRFVTF
jgi:hypothetical protein